ncbi:MAG: hypothetical protein RR283_03175 [Comamonas sp.]
MPRIAIRNPNRTILIDDNYENLVFRAKYTAFFAQPALGQLIIRTQDLDVPIINGIPPVLALRVSSPGTATGHILRTQIIGSTLRVTVYTNISVDTGDCTFEVYAFDTPQAQSTGSGVVILRNKSTGRVTFDSDLRYLRVVDSISGTSATSRQYDNTRKHAIVMGRLQYSVTTDVIYLESSGAWRWIADWNYITTRWASGLLNVVNMRKQVRREADSGSGGGSWSQSGFTLFVVDVTGF